MAIEEKRQQTVKVAGKGESKTAAIADALTKIQKTILKDSSDVILRIEPVSVEVLEAKEFTYTEKFLFFFMPRTRTAYEVKLLVTTEMLLIESSKVPFSKVNGRNEAAIRLPFTSKRI